MVPALLDARRPDRLLAVLAALSLAIYLIAFVWPYNLLAWWQKPLLSVSQMTHHDLRAGALYTLSFAALFFLYVSAIRIGTGLHTRRTWAIVLLAAASFNLAMIWLYPIGAADIFDYIVRGRMTAFYGANPFYQVPSQFPGNPLSGYNAWNSVTTAYGPLWEGIAAMAARIPGDGVLPNVLVFKSVCMLAYAVATGIIALFLRRSAPERTLAGVILFAWNPLAIYFTAGNGNNDAAMTAFVVLGYLALQRGRFTLAAVAETAGALVKYLPALLVPIVMLAALKRLKSWRARISYTLITTGACAALVGGCYLPFWRGGDILGMNWRSQLYTTSLPTLLEVTLAPRMGQPAAQLISSRAAYFLMAAWLLWQLWRLLRSHAEDTDAPIRAGVSILLFYLLVTSLWVQPWYVIWPLSLVALLPDGILRRGTVLLSFALTWKMPIFEFVLAPRGILPPLIWREWRLTIGTLGVPWAYFVYHFFRELFTGLRQGLGIRSTSRRKASAPWLLHPSSEHDVGP